MKTHLLVPNLWLYDLAFKIYGPNSLKFGDFLSENQTRKCPCLHSTVPVLPTSSSVTVPVVLL